MTVYEWFNNTFTDEFVILALNLPPDNFDDRPRPHKRSRYTTNMLPASISVASENYFSTLTTPYDSPYLLTYDYPNAIYVMNMDVPFLGMLHIGYYCKKNNKKDSTKLQGSIDPHDLIRTPIFKYCHGFSRIDLYTRTFFLEHQCYML